ncbi:MAG TPA: hypothetical protein PKH24_16840 [Sedimentisphaerales bacterium]|nr:hypothetical protein [Sedimentisphaerales bacterium]HNU30519.1 hypothetical protein [Sedimentisphaerales bacterium]
MRILQCSVLVILAVGTAGPGCARRTVTVRTHDRQRTVPMEPTWGQPAEGLQCRLRSDKRIYPAGENPTFRIDLRNQGGRIFAFRSTDQAPLSQYSIDSRWRRWPAHPPQDGKVRPLGPGVEIADMPATLPQDARSLLTPGLHVIQLAFSFEGVEVVSNPIEIEVVGQ